MTDLNDKIAESKTYTCTDGKEFHGFQKKEANRHQANLDFMNWYDENCQHPAVDTGAEDILDFIARYPYQVKELLLVYI